MGAGPAVEWTDVADEELRFAAVFNGGVSLAVWIGGVSHELNLLTRSDPAHPGPPGTDYCPVARAIRSTAVVDVIAGTSAGGINGGALALAQLDRGTDLGQLRDLWSVQGDLDQLLRKPFQGDPNSLLRGDDYFLPRLAEAMRRLVDSGTGATGADVDLMVTTTLLEPAVLETEDSLGQTTRQNVSDGIFRFRLGFDPVDGPDDAAAAGRRAIAAEIALAARASAGFPFAFEPTWIPVDSAATTWPHQALRPDMRRSASWRHVVDGTPVDRSRFAVDGGLLANTPARPALTAIRGRGANGPVRRVMVIAFPHAPQSTHEDPRDFEDAPTFTGTALKILGALKSQGSRSFVEEIEEHNRRVRNWRNGRATALGLASGPGVTALYEFVAAGWSAYRMLRGYDAEQPDVPAGPPPDPACAGSFDVVGEQSTTRGSWPWGPAVAGNVVDSVAEVLRRALGVARDADGADGNESAVLGAAREDVAAVQVQIEAVADELRMNAGAAADRAGLLARLVHTAAERISAAPVSALLDRIAAEPRGHATGLDVWRRVLTEAVSAGEPPGDDARVQRLVLRLLALDVATWLIANAETTGYDLPIAHVQLSLAVDHPWATESTTPEDKAAGLRLGHFAGFLKSSWRVNDWIWGRLDAARLLSETALSPERLRRIRAATGLSADDAVRAVLAELDRGYEQAAPPHLRQDAEAELRRLFTTADELKRLPAVATLAALPRQRRIIVEELPALARAVELDQQRAHDPRSRGELFLRQAGSLLGDIEHGREQWEALGDRALAAFDRAGIGRETLADEAGSDAMIKTATTAAAVGVTVLDSKRFGTGAIRPVTRAIRGAALLPYWLLIGLTRGTSTARALALAGFGLGGVLLTLGVLGFLGSVSTVAALAGTATLLAAFAYAALRSGSLLHGVVLLGPAVPLAAYVGAHQLDDADTRQAIGTIVVVLAVALGLILLGSIPWPVLTPVDTVRTKPGQAVRMVLGLLALVAVVGLALLPALVDVHISWTRIDQRVRDATGAPWWLHAGAGVLAVVAGTLVAGRGRVTASWSVVYGAVYLAAAGALVAVLQTSGPFEPVTEAVVVASLVWSTLLGAVLTLVVPTVLRARRIST